MSHAKRLDWEKIADDLAARDLLALALEQAQLHHCTLADICSERHQPPRHVAIARAHIWGAMLAKGLSYPEIGRLFGRDHSTVHKVVKRYLKPSPSCKCGWLLPTAVSVTAPAIGGVELPGPQVTMRCPTCGQHVAFEP